MSFIPDRPNVDLREPLRELFTETLDNMRGFKWTITQGTLGKNFIYLNLDESSLNALCKLLPSEDDQELNQLTAKIQKKIASAAEVIRFLDPESESKGVDPRVERLGQKVGQLNLQDPATISKIRKYTQLLNSLRADSNVDTWFNIQNVSKRLKELRMELLQNKPEIRSYDIRDKHLLLEHYLEVQDPITCLKAGKEQASIEFLSKMLRPDSENISLCSKSFIKELITLGHEKAGNPDENFGEPQLSLSAIFEGNKSRFFHVIELDQEASILPCHMLCTDTIRASLLALLKTKRDNELTTISALIRFCDRHLMVSIDSDDTIYFFDQHSDGTGNQCPYIAAFNGVGQAAPFLYIVIDKELTQYPFSANPITINAVCDRRELEIRKRDRHNREEVNRLHFSVFPNNDAVPFEDEDDDFPLIVPVTIEQFAPPVACLQEAINGLSLCTEEGFFQAVEALSKLSEFTFCSPINGDSDRQALDRIYFQLYHIHEKETPKKIDRTDKTWGTNAFQSDELATPEEKLRAAQRVQVEVLMFLAGAVRQNDQLAQAVFPLILGALEKMQLDARDLPQGQKNLAHCLFGNLYSIYLAAWDKNKTMTHPHDGIFKKDFGRNAFVDEKVRNSIPIEYKLQAFDALAKSLKDAWKI